ncbi:hypothetical protein CVT26_006581 [Gymnopilus dilepis]|uniref:Major facilitator superfamily (MFS) profile domain-containing protein n=1 Tax=Gymnopilus dilepis TaxID=231916 RepID=A0A409Y2V5_9AGAR|nr:hypothetical protein CVT26_006581 [Gymnopilus dilepis]
MRAAVVLGVTGEEEEPSCSIILHSAVRWLLTTFYKANRRPDSKHPFPTRIDMFTPLSDKLRSVSLIFACGTALFGDGYANGVIGNVNTRTFLLNPPGKSFENNFLSVLTRIYGQGELSNHKYSRTLSSVAFVGAVVGMLIFGYMTDKIGRKFGMLTASGIIALFSGLSAASKGAHGSVDGLLSMLSAMRFFVGIGLGAEYPCGAVSAAEQSEESGISKGAQHRWLALATNSILDFGFVIASFVPLILFWILGNDHLNAVWRLSLGLGIIPASAVFLWRLSMDEPVRYKQDCMKYTRIPYVLVLRRYGVRLAAISFVWFLYDFIVYPQFSIYSSIIIDRITGGSENLAVVFGWNVVINLFYMPGTLGGALIIDRLGPKYTMITGLLLQAAIGFIMSGAYEQESSMTRHIAAFTAVYGVFLSFGELGPGNCLGLLASKTSPTAVRGQFYGIAAAVGKIGAFIGTWVFPPIIDAFGGPSTTRGNTGPFWIGSGLAILSALVTFVFIEPLDADCMTREDSDFRDYLEAHGFDTSLMGLPGEASTVSSVDIGVKEKEALAA